MNDVKRKTFFSKKQHTNSKTLESPGNNEGEKVASFLKYYF